MNRAVEALGWTLVHFCWQATILAGVYWLLDPLLKKSRSQVRYLLSLTALLLMFGMALATLGYEALRSSANILSFPETVVSVIPAIRQSISAGNTIDARGQSTIFRLNSLLPWLDLAWLIGVSCFSTRTITGWWWIQRLRRLAMEKAPESVFAISSRICSRLGIARIVELRICEHIPGPLTIGVARSIILLPASALLALDPEQLEVVLTHELAHVLRADYLWNLIQTTIETLFFFHPAVWWLGRRVRHQRELCCDDLALASCADPLVYATALLHMAEHRQRRMNLAMALDGNQTRSGLRIRIARILGETPPPASRWTVRPLSLAAMCLTFVLFLSPLPRVFGGRSSLTVQKQTQTETRAAIPPLPVEDRAAQTAEEEAALQKQVMQRPAEPEPGRKPAHAEPDYIGQMRAAGYDVDIDKDAAMKMQGITPEYARAMAGLGLGKPSAGELITMKDEGITPESISALRSAGMVPKSIRDVIAWHMFNVSPEFISKMKAAGFATVSPREALQLRVMGVTPEYAASMKRQFPDVTVRDLLRLHVFRIDDNFIAQAKAHGFDGKDLNKLLRLKMSGLLDP